MYNSVKSERGTVHLIQFDHVSFHYEESVSLALNDINLVIPDGSFIAVVGHNGSGKSTLAKHINGLLTPSEGTVTVNGMTTSEEENLLSIRQNVGIVFQNPDNQIVTTIIEEDVAFGPENMGIPPEEIRIRVDEALATVGMQEYARREIHKLSGGQKQRIAIAGMLALKPRILVMDEATAMLDPKGRSDGLKTLRELHAQGLTIIMVTQYMEEVTDCDRVVVMNHGQIVKDDTPANVFADPALLHSCSLTVPEAIRLSTKIRSLGVPLSENTMNTEQLAEELCRLL